MDVDLLFWWSQAPRQKTCLVSLNYVVPKIFIGFVTFLYILEGLLQKTPIPVMHIKVFYEKIRVTYHDADQKDIRSMFEEIIVGLS